MKLNIRDKENYESNQREIITFRLTGHFLKHQQKLEDNKKYLHMLRDNNS